LRKVWPTEHLQCAYRGRQFYLVGCHQD
jgi:hypothetical protein